MRKQLLYLTNTRLTAYEWNNGGLSEGIAFFNDGAGWAAFAHYLDGMRNVRLYMLADLVEEDFQRENMPHVVGRTRRALIERRLTQLYRETPYRQATVQGREKEGRKDDRLLLSALTNQLLLTPWMEAILNHKLPLVGIYSPALLSAALLKKLDIARDHLLLVTQQSSGLRQSYFHGTALKFSRLTTFSQDTSGNITDALAAEMAKTQQFLANTRLQPRGEPIHIVIMMHGEQLQHLQEAYQDTPTLTHVFIDLAEALKTVGFKDAEPSLLADHLFMAALAHGAPAHSYLPPEQAHFFKLWKARLALYGLSALMLTTGLTWAEIDRREAGAYRQQSTALKEEAARINAKYDAIIASLPKTEISPQSMKIAVDLEQMIVNNAPAPATMISALSHVLNMMPQIRIDQLQWQVSENIPVTAENAAAASARAIPPPARAVPLPPGAAEPGPSAVLIGVPKKPVQILVIEGTVVPFEHDYRTALESTRQLAAELGRTKQFTVEITRPPLDIRPIVKLEGQAGNNNASAKAQFVLKLVWAPEG